jgi:hypothetical protein
MLSPSPTDDTSFGDFLAEGSLFNMSVPPRTRFESKITPVAGRVLLFDASLALKTHIGQFSTSQRRREIFDLDLEDVPDRRRVESAALRLPAFAIGLLVDEETKPKPSSVRDPALVIALLARRAGRIFVRSRTPDYTVEFLLGDSFALEDWGFRGRRRR